MPTLQELTERVRDAASGHPGLSRPVTLDLGETGCIRIDDGKVDNTDGPADCRISFSADDLEALMNGRLDPTTAYMNGQLRVDGDMTLALELASALGRA
jgi:putative sterol carrier protein